jgi:hypothetical protein
MPIRIGPPGQEKIFHVFSRIHGDIERDKLEATNAIFYKQE